MCTRIQDAGRRAGRGLGGLPPGPGSLGILGFPCQVEPRTLRGPQSPVGGEVLDPDPSFPAQRTACRTKPLSSSKSYQGSLAETDGRGRVRWDPRTRRDALRVRRGMVAPGTRNPRLLSDVGCGEARPWSQPSPSHSIFFPSAVMQHVSQRPSTSLGRGAGRCRRARLKLS